MKTTTVRLRGASVQPKKVARRPLAERLRSALPVLMGSMVVVILIGGLIYLPGYLDQQFPLRSIGVDGVADVRRQQEVKMTLAGVVEDRNFFNLSLADIYRRTGSLTWVADVKVRRVWPDTLRILVEEYVPIAVWNDDLLIASNGTPFRALEQYDTEQLPRLNGPSEKPQTVMDYYHSVNKVLAPAGLRIRQLDVDARLTAHLQLENGIQVWVDREQMARKLMRFVKLYEGELVHDSRGVARVDLRYADGMAVAWRQSSSSMKERI